MKKLMFFFALMGFMLCASPIVVLGADGSFPDIGNPFISFVALVAAIPVIAEIVISLFKPPSGIWTQAVSWVVGLGLTLLGWWLNLGILADILWWQAILIALCASLAANGIWDTGLYEAILRAIGLIKGVKKV